MNSKVRTGITAIAGLAALCSTALIDIAQAAAQTFTGSTERNPRGGSVQVQITVNNGKITDVQALSYPDGDGRSQYISSVMIPWLTQETLKVQSTNIMNVSGATITGNAWKYSLASAMQQAGL